MSETVLSILNRKGPAIWSIAPDATVYSAIALMAEKSIGALLVMEEQKLIGIVTERDYARKVILAGRSSRDTLVREIMTSHLVTVTPDYTVDDCMRIINLHRIRHLPVLEGDRTVGLVSIGDLVKAIISAQAQTIDDLHTYIGVKYPA